MFPQTARLVGGGISRLLDLFLPPHCALCKAATFPGVHACGTCLKAIPRITPPRCQLCSCPMMGDVTLSISARAALICAECREVPPDFESAVALRLSRGPARELLHRFKYQRQTHLRHLFAGWLLETLDDPRLKLPPPTALVAVPLHPLRRYQRGFNQADEIASLAARELGLPLLRPLRRIRATSSQTRLDRTARMENLRNAFSLRQNAAVRDHHLILIDDVMTTGSTLSECARILRRAGAASVRAAAVLRG